ncbi:hypothetical protein [Pelagibius sp. Alg239-R121]|uniref:hypothetical protein n=1 Tax=Pelagibius sp. Alg239-R121 TaxID=2993448 RepID=UPI0024A65F2D|nr:hypothetical protein [Pelagibius sp. Alg239-R121]
MTMTPAERQRRFRERLRNGATQVTIELLPIHIERLLDCGWLTEEESERTSALARAFLSSWERSPPVNSPEKTVTALRTGLFDPDRISRIKRDREHE